MNSRTTLITEINGLRPTRWGVVGTGHISRQVTHDLRQIEGVQVSAVASRSLEKATAFGDELGIPLRFAEYAELLESDVEVVYLGTPHVTHFELAKAALLHGKHVLCEKPIALNAHEVRELALIARRQGRFLMEAMWMKFNPLMRLVGEIIESGEIGTPRSVQASFGAPFPQDGSSRWQPGGSALLDQGIYPVTLSHLILGAPEKVHASGAMDSTTGNDVSEHFTLEYSDGRFSQGASSMVEFLGTSAAVSGDRGWISIDPGFWFATGLTVHTYSASGPSARRCEVQREGYGYTPMLRAVNEAVRAGLREHPTHTLDDTAAVFDTLDAIRREVFAATS